MPPKRARSRKARGNANNTSLETVAESDENAVGASAEEQSPDEDEPTLGQEKSQARAGKLKPLKRGKSPPKREKSPPRDDAGGAASPVKSSGRLSPISAKKKKGQIKSKLRGAVRIVGLSNAEVMAGPETGSFDNILKALSQRQGDWLPALSEAQMLELAAKVQVITFDKNDLIYDESQEGEDAMNFYVLLDGYVKGTIQKGNKSQKLFTTRTFGSTFGDRSLIGGCPRPHILVAKTKAVTGKVQKQHYVDLFRKDFVALEKVRTIAMSTATKAGRMKKGLLLEVMSQAELLSIADESLILWFRERETIVQQGDSLDSVGAVAKQMYMLESGTVEVTVRVQDPITDQISERLVETLDQSGSLFGEAALMYGTKRTATVTAKTDCRVCAIPHRALDNILESRPEVRKKFGDLVGGRKTGYTTATAGFLIADPAERSALPTDAQVQEESANVEDTVSSESDKADRTRAAHEIKVVGEEQMKQAMFLFDSVARSGDWERYHPEIQKALQAAEEQFGMLETEYSSELPLDGLNVKNLQEQIQKLEYLKVRANAWMPVLPVMEEDEFRSFSNRRLTNTVSQYNSSPHKLRAHGFPVDWRSMRDVCNFMEKLPTIIQNSIDGIPRFQGFMKVKYGEKMAGKLHRDLLVWYERKQAAWDVQHELNQQRLVKKSELNTNLKELRLGQDEHGELRRATSTSIVEMRCAQLEATLEDLESMDARINEDLASLNQAVVRSSFAFVSPPPGRALIDSPLLAYALHLQRILELREDFRLGRAVTTQHAQMAISKLIRDSTLHSVNTKGKNASIDDYVFRNKDGTRKVAPIVKDFMGELGSWLFTTDTGRWERQARITGQLTGLPKIEGSQAQAANH